MITVRNLSQTTPSQDDTSLNSRFEINMLSNHRYYLIFTLKSAILLISIIFLVVVPGVVVGVIVVAVVFSRLIYFKTRLKLCFKLFRIVLFNIIVRSRIS